MPEDGPASPPAGRARSLQRPAVQQVEAEAVPHLGASPVGSLGRLMHLGSPVWRPGRARSPPPPAEFVSSSGMRCWRGENGYTATIPHLLAKATESSQARLALLPGKRLRPPSSVDFLVLL